MKSTIEYQKLCYELLHAESEQRVLEILAHYNLTDHRNWKILGDMPNNRAMVNNQQQDPIGAMVEKAINQIDAVLTKACFLAGINPDDQSKAPKSMAEAAETMETSPIYPPPSLPTLLGGDRNKIRSLLPADRFRRRSDTSSVRRNFPLSEKEQQGAHSFRTGEIQLRRNRCSSLLRKRSL